MLSKSKINAMKKVEFEGLTCFTVDLEVGHSPLSEKFNCLVLESNPEPDYYALQNFPPNERHVSDRHIYLLAKDHKNCFQDIVLKASYKLKSRLRKDVRLFPGQMSFHNKDYQGIRINTSTVEVIPIIIDELKKDGIVLMGDRKVESYTSLIYYKKYLEFVELEEGVYQDNDNKNRYFFKIPNFVEFDEFRAKMDKIKNNCNYHLFDSFLASLFIKEAAHSFIGIYSKHCDKTRFGDLKKEITNLFF